MLSLIMWHKGYLYGTQRQSQAFKRVFEYLSQLGNVSYSMNQDGNGSTGVRVCYQVVKNKQANYYLVHIGRNGGIEYKTVNNTWRRARNLGEIIAR